MNILITSAGQRVSLVKAFQYELKKLFIQAKVFTVDMNPDLAPACHISDGFKKINEVSNSDYINNLLAICLELEIKLIIPTIDTELQKLADNLTFFRDHDIQIVVSSPELINICRDKRNTNDFFNKMNIELPIQYHKSKLQFPLFIKPFDGSLSKDIFLIETPSELTDYHLNHPKLMFMEYIDHKIHEEFTVDTYYDKNNELKCVVPRKRILVRAGEVNKAVTRKNEIVEYIKNKLSRIEGAIGCLTMQFFFNPTSKRIIGIEINPRFGGGYPLSYLAGANFPKWIIEEYLLNNSIPYFENWKENFLMLRYDAEVMVENHE